MPRRPHPISRTSRPALAWLLACCAALLPLVLTSHATADSMALLRVTHTGDSGAGSLRQAILDANASPEGDRIEFAIHLCDPACVIRPNIALPPLTGGDLIIDGFSQSGASPPSAEAAAVIRIAIDGSGVENQNGLNIASSNNHVHGLAIYGFGGNGIAIGGPEARYNQILGSHIGLDAEGIGLASRRPNGLHGVFLGLGARNNTIGGDLLTERNVISGNAWAGIGVHGSDTINNFVQGNFIGLDASGRTALPNSLDGLQLYGGAGPLVVGVVEDLGQRNVISGNGRDGLRMMGAETNALFMDGNLVGTDLLGLAAVPNLGDGLHVMDGARNVSIGTASQPSLNLFSGNQGHGIHFEGSGGGAVIQRSLIGVDASGQERLPNEDGIHIQDSESIRIGGGELGQANRIAGNRGLGILIGGEGSTSNTIEGSVIGGSAELGNALGGVRIEGGARDHRVGGSNAAQRRGNMISGNGRSAVEIDGLGSDENRIRGNRIGTDWDGESALGNAAAGVYVRGGAASNQIGGFGEGEGNWIVANGLGISLQGAGRGTLVYANRIGLASDPSSSSLGNLGAGIRIEDGTVEARLQGNHVAYNAEEGVLIQGEPTLGNRLRGNAIHDNGGPGIRVTNGAHRGILPPVLEFYDPARLRLGGRGCTSCEVEVFSDAAEEGEMPLVVGTVSGGGEWGVTLPEAPERAHLTAIVTDVEAGSSAFSLPLPAAASTSTPTASPTRSAIPSATATTESTFTPTSTSSSTPSPSATATWSPTPGQTPDPTIGPSSTPTHTASATPTASLSATPTETGEPEPTPSPTIGDEALIWLPILQRAWDPASVGDPTFQAGLGRPSGPPPPR